jgi:hypothetical protein
MSGSSQNVRFTADVALDELDEHSPGESYTRQLAAAATQAGWETSEFDLWRDCGWSVECRRGEAALLLVLAKIQKPYWLVQINPLSRPGLLARLFGARSPDFSSEIFALSQAVDLALAGIESVRIVGWSWDGYPEDGAAAMHPEPFKTRDSNNVPSS